jgi:hypothetical protein
VRRDRPGERSFACRPVRPGSANLPQKPAGLRTEFGIDPGKLAEKALEKELR